jgi:hypothetical protein
MQPTHVTSRGEKCRAKEVILVSKAVLVKGHELTKGEVTQIRFVIETLAEIVNRANRQLEGGLDEDITETSINESIKELGLQDIPVMTYLEIVDADEEENGCT